MNRLLHWLREPVDGASLAVFRIAFGVILLWDVFRHWSHTGSSMEKIKALEK